MHRVSDRTPARSSNGYAGGFSAASTPSAGDETLQGVPRFHSLLLVPAGGKGGALRSSPVGRYVPTNDKL